MLCYFHFRVFKRIITDKVMKNEKKNGLVILKLSAVGTGRCGIRSAPEVKYDRVYATQNLNVDRWCGLPRSTTHPLPSRDTN